MRRRNDSNEVIDEQRKGLGSDAISKEDDIIANISYALIDQELGEFPADKRIISHFDI